MALQIPTVTIDDLRDFHATHFPHAPAPEHILHDVEPEAAAVDEYYEEDDGLGFYPDGTKRTLTDEQITLFRHSEIQTILRKRRLRRENGELSEEEPDQTPNAATAASLGPSTKEATPNNGDGANETSEGKVEEPKKQHWATTSARTRAKNKRKRTNYASKRKERRIERGLPRRRSGRPSANNDADEDDESDEWDPWHQANGPDVQKDDTLDLDY